MKHSVIIVGGGAAGLACASRLTKQNADLNVAVIDAGERLGKKLSATGNGQGNVTNLSMDISRYFCGNPALVEKLVCGKGENTEKELFHMILSSDGRGRVYPNGRQASALTDSLISDLKRGNVNVITGVKATDIRQGFTLTLSDGREIGAEYVVLAVGGKAQKQFKTDGSSYRLAEKFGHTVTPLYPSLVQLKTDTRHIKSLKGIRTDCLVSAIYGGKVIAKRRGDVIFTEYGVSGNAIFEISPYVTDKQGVTLSLRFLPDDDGGLLQDIRRKKTLDYERNELLAGTLHNQLGRAILRRCEGGGECEIVNAVQNFTLPVTGNLGFDYAQVTKGGVNMNEVTHELESKFAKNLFFAGEVLDVDGECGGYNLHWAFVSGVKAAEVILQRTGNIEYAHKIG